MEACHSRSTPNITQSTESAPLHIAIPLDHTSNPEPRHESRSSDGEREATELRDIGAIYPTSITGGTSSANIFQRFWKNNVKLSVPHAACRDHLANERTFLGYLRTSATLSIQGVFLLQLYRLQHSEHPDPVFGYYVLGRPVACLFQVSALAVLLLGSVRFFRQQQAMAAEKVYAGGWEFSMVGLWSLLMLLLMFVLHLAVDIYKGVR
nr:hypothetical protein CFP56_74889 [Quercus suber]